MARKRIAYRSGYKYQLDKAYTIGISIKPKKDIDTKFIKLDKTGKLTVVAGYAWDGPSGPVVDRKENMRASLVHDALYQLMRNRKLTARRHQDKADRLFMKLCIEDGVTRTLARAYYAGLRIGGNPSTDPKNKKEIHRAP